MQKRTREILALVLLAVLVVVGVAVMGWYILVGHNWNVAASNIDDSIGQMDGYKVFVFEGTRLPDEQRERLSDSQPLLDDANRGTSTLDQAREAANEPLELERVASSYRSKGAAVFVLDVADLAAYEEPFVVGKDGLRVGLFSVPAPAHLAQALIDLKLLRHQHADYLVALTDDFALCEERAVGIDLLVCTDEQMAPDGGYVGSTFCVGSPYVGEVQAVIMSPSGVLSTKTITRL